MRLTQSLRDPIDAALSGGSELAFEFIRWRGDEALSVRWSRSDLAGATARAAGAIARQTAPGDRVVVAASPGPDFVAAFLGCLAAGRIAVPAPTPATVRGAQTVARLRDVTSATLVLTAAPDGPPLEPARQTADAIAYLQFTSGSTQAPRGAIVTIGALAANLAAIADAWALGAGDVGAFWLPPFHDMGLVGAILAPLACGFPAALMHPAAFVQRPARWLDLMASRRATFSGGPNFAYDLCVERGATDADLSFWRVAVNGSEPVSAATMRRFSKTFARNRFRAETFAPGYGLAESVLFATARRSDGPLVTDDGPVSCGPAGRGVIVRIVDEVRERVLPEGETGAIWLAGDSLAAGYWNAPDDASFGARLAGEPHSFLRTGDIGFMCGGELIVCGRAKDVIVRAGRKTHASDIEHEIAARLGAGARSAAFSDTDGAVERIVVVHELRPAACAATVRAQIAEALGEAFEIVADTIVLAPPGAIRTTTSGKVARAATRDAWRAGAFRSLAP
jgi:acyl-CoA synthetase (AMP-forming)/AMP-acid ligase II